jgi:hypothetical protein
MDFTSHFKDIVKERSIRRVWIDVALAEPEKVEDHDDGTRHFLRRIEEHGNRWLRVIVNVESEPTRAITAFFDRRLREKR